ncbi:MAG: YdcF family protein [Sandaracinaceae bacterium]|nr:YdcF family protein [Sandaracinaceae bacterium]
MIARRGSAAVRAGLALAALGCGPPLGHELFMPQARLQRADAIVVLGHSPAQGVDGALSAELERRVRHGARLQRQGLAPVLIVTGGAYRDTTEAALMAERARALGVPSEAIVLEPRARDTAQNARFAIERLCEVRGRRQDRARCAPSVIVVSSPYHLRRAALLFTCAGARVQIAATEPPPDWGSQARSALHEYAARLAYLVDDACARAAPQPAGQPR